MFKVFHKRAKLGAITNNLLLSSIMNAQKVVVFVEHSNEGKIEIKSRVLIS